MFVVHNPVEPFSGLAMLISPPPLPSFKLLDPKRTEIVQGTRVSRTPNPQKQNLWPDQVKYHLSARGKRRWHEAEACAAYPVGRCPLQSRRPCHPALQRLQTQAESGSPHENRFPVPMEARKTVSKYISFVVMSNNFLGFSEVRGDLFFSPTLIQGHT
jgi:hypothetical protein